MTVKTISIIVLIITGIIYYSYNYDRITLHGIHGEILMLVLNPETSYSKYYTHKNFAKVQMGMTEHEVIKLLGDPILKWQPYKYTNFRNKAHYIGYQYSESPSGSHYELRQIYFDNGKVAEIIAYLYID